MTNPSREDAENWMRTPPSLLSCARSALWAAVSFVLVKIVQIMCMMHMMNFVRMRQMMCQVYMLNIMPIVQMYKLYRLMQVITSPEQVRAGRVRNAKLGVEKLIEEHLPSSLSEYILFETVL